ncbi:sialate O-acetylesterase [Dyadobacter arcticus]|uniref:Sialate O-acetylesterase domain-containing protein n=1 Tax=Dyadobacter arcticus TaxID=1078754 RepID=A0ABX0UN30_9BACT|nr:sialate O-acetylesterase [Dyadobacter arcticus]NIJ52491.1 hypothetical protein [Dyadobacter arcticus]
MFGDLLLHVTIYLILLSCATFAQPVAPRKQFHLYLLAGQSNMAGRGAVEEQDKTTHPRVWVLTKDNIWQLATEPLHFDKPAVIGVGPGFAFAKAMADLDTNQDPHCHFPTRSTGLKRNALHVSLMETAVTVVMPYSSPVTRMVSLLINHSRPTFKFELLDNVFHFNFRLK